ncbi:hypothetical protein K3753_11485 [Sulfitobacter mediterraneus]|nr:hypothetical protein K3753_11485 [Sulfitobacter mediterraneus]
MYFVTLADVNERPRGKPRGPFCVWLVGNSLQEVCATMTVITPDEEIAHGVEILDALRAAIRVLRQEIEGQTQTARSGEDIDKTQMAKQLRDMQGLVTQCTKAEMFLNDCRNRQAGIARAGHALDLEQARADIGCKLDRLRRCSGAGRISG